MSQLSLDFPTLQHVVCYSGGHSSALTAISVVKRYGRDNVILVNHDINPRVEDADIKRFKREVADWLGIPVTFVNYKDADADQFDICVKHKGFKARNGNELCTSRLKTQPFMDWLLRTFPQKNCVIYYGFDANETVRIQRRSGILGADGYRTDFPLALWPTRVVRSTREIGIEPPNTYGVFKHANCIGCLKAGWQHWYVVYCTRPDIWEKAKWAEDEIGHAIHFDKKLGPVYLEDMEPRFSAMKTAAVAYTEHVPQQRFWADAKKLIPVEFLEDSKPCECVF